MAESEDTNDLVIRRGETFGFTIEVFDLDENGEEVAFDLTGVTPKGQLKRGFTSAEPPIDLDCSLADAEGGIVACGLTAAETSGIEIRSGVYDVILPFTDGRVIRIVEGRWTLSLEVTKNVVGP
jgi:hypothetical protein